MLQEKNWVDFLGRSSPGSNWDRAVYAVVDNLNIHSATDVLLFALPHPRWEFVFQPKYAAYLNLIEPWWKIMRSLALKGRRFETWAEIEQAVRTRNRLLERAQTSLPLGPQPASPDAPPLRPRRRAKCHKT